MNERTFSNPIIPGFHPDPSILRVGDDYYIATADEWDMDDRVGINIDASKVRLERYDPEKEKDDEKTEG